MWFIPRIQRWKQLNALKAIPWTHCKWGFLRSGTAVIDLKNGSTVNLELWHCDFLHWKMGCVRVSWSKMSPIKLETLIYKSLSKGQSWDKTPVYWVLDHCTNALRRERLETLVAEVQYISMLLVMVETFGPCSSGKHQTDVYPVSLFAVIEWFLRWMPTSTNFRLIGTNIANLTRYLQ